jgi:hypothetical protein
MPENESEVWQHFTAKYHVVTNAKTGHCKYCDCTYVSYAKRMQKHLAQGCSDCPEDVKKTFLSILEPDEVNKDNSSGSSVVV